MSHFLLAVFATPFALAASLFAQEPSPGSTPSASDLAALRTPIHGHVGGEAGDGDYGLWAAGAGYKASFVGGMRFVPYVAPGAESISFAWRTTSARVGATELVTRPTPELSHGEWRAEYDHGGIVEAYDVRQEGLEQTFVLATRPASAGDLVIRGAVTTTLQPAPTAGHADVSWLDADGTTFLSYGAAWAVDASGRRCPMTTTVGEGGLELRLSADWLATAAFPLVVDPLLAPVAISAGPPAVTAVAIVHDHSGPSRLWYAEVRLSGTDTDLWLYRADSTGANPVLVFSDLSANWSSVEPALARNLPSTKVVLAYTREIFASNTKRVRGHVHARADVVFQNPVFDVPAPGGENHWRPALGEELSPVSFTTVPLVFQVEPSGVFTNGNFSQIYGVDVLCGGAGNTGNYFSVAAVPSVDHERPSVGQCSSGPARRFTVAYQRYAWFGASGFEWNVAVRRFTGVTVGVERLVDNGQLDRHEMAPRVAGNDDRLMLVCTASTIAESANKPAGANGHRIRGTRIDWDNDVLLVPHGSRDLQVNGDARLEIGGLAYDFHSDSHWGLGFRSNVTDTIYFGTYGFQGLELVSETVHVAGAGTSVGGAVVFQSADNEFLIAYGANEPGVGNFSRVRRWQYPALGTPFSSGQSCTTTTIDWWGRQRIGTEACGVVFNNAPANALTLCLVATASASLQLFGISGVEDGCWLLVPLAGPDYLGTLPASTSGAMQWHLPLPEGLPNMTLRFQAVSLDLADGLLHSSSRLTVPIGL